MRRFVVLLVLAIVACNGPNTSPPPTGTILPTLIAPSATSVIETPIPPTTISDTPAASAVPATETSNPSPVTETATAPPTAETATAPSGATNFPDPNAYQWQPVVSGLQRPVDLQADGSGRLFVIEKVGRIRIIQDGQLLATPFLDISDRVNSSGNEQGLLGLAFHPQYAQNGRFFVNYTDNNSHNVIARFQVSSDPNVAEPNSEARLVAVDDPFPNHNGGVLTFGPDGYLYAGLGDGGSQGDPFNNAQNTGVLLGKILRFDVNSADPYAVPGGNPFGNEVWAYGLRNPWRISFDRGTGDLYIADVGQNMWEEIDYLPAGSPGGTNFGWSFREGKHDYKGGGPSGLVDPVAEYSHPEGGCSVTGGYIYRGSMPEWNGIYLYGDYCTGFIWGLIHTANGWQTQQLFDLDVNITSFGQDTSGEIYLVSDNGGIFRLVHQ